jgi:hypothetical protein
VNIGLAWDTKLYIELREENEENYSTLSQARVQLSAFSPRCLAEPRPRRILTLESPGCSATGYSPYTEYVRA